MIEVPVLIVLHGAHLSAQRRLGQPAWRCGRTRWPNRRTKCARVSSWLDAYYEQSRFAEAAENYEIASHLAPPDYRLLVDYGLALDRGRAL